MSPAYLKIMTDKRAGVCLYGGVGEAPSAYGFTESIPSTTSGMLGTEFIFALPAGQNAAYPRVILAVEEAEIKIYEQNFTATGKLLEEFKLTQNNFRGYNFMGNTVYRVTSTGRIMIELFQLSGVKYLPSVTGRYVDKEFLGLTIGSDAYDTGAFIVTPQEEGSVKIYDEKKRLAYEKTFTASEVNPPSFWRIIGILEMHAFKFVSTGNITVITTDNPEHMPAKGPPFYAGGDDISELPVPAGQTVTFYAWPRPKAIIFALERTNIVLDDVRGVIRGDEFLLVDEGWHTLKPDRPVIVQVQSMAFGDPLPTTLGSYGAWLVPVEDASLQLSKPTESQAGLGLPLEAIAGIAAAVVVIVVIVVFRVRGRPSKPAPA